MKRVPSFHLLADIASWRYSDAKRNLNGLYSRLQMLRSASSYGQTPAQREQKYIELGEAMDRYNDARRAYEEWCL